MEAIKIRPIDDLCRISIPREVRAIKGWQPNDNIGFYNYNGVIVIEQTGKPWDPKQIEEIMRLHSPQIQE